MQQISLENQDFQGICDAHAFLYYSIIRPILRGVAALSVKMMCSSHLLQHFLRSHIGEQLTAVQAQSGDQYNLCPAPCKTVSSTVCETAQPCISGRAAEAAPAPTVGGSPCSVTRGCLMTVSAKDPINRMILQEPNQAVRSSKVVGISFRCSRSVYRVVQRESLGSLWGRTAPVPATQVGCRTIGQ